MVRATPVPAAGRAVGHGHHRRAGAVGDLDLAGPPAGVREERGVAVAEHAGDGHVGGERRQVEAVRRRGRSRRPRGAAPRRARRTASSSQGSQVRVVRSSSWVRDALPASIRCSPPMRHSSQESTVPRHSSPRRLRVRSGSWTSSRADALEAENIASSGSPVSARTSVGVALGPQPRAQGGTPGVLPAEQRTQRLTGGPVPQQHRLALGAQPDRGDPCGVDLAQGEPDGLLRGAPDLQRVLLGPARARELLVDRYRGPGPHRPARGRRRPPWWRSSPGRSPGATRPARVLQP